MSMKMNEYDQWLLRQKQDAYAMEQHQIKGAIAGGNLGEQRQEQPVAAAIETLRARLAQTEQEWKYNPMTGEPLIDGWPLYSGLPKREWQGLTNEEVGMLTVFDGLHHVEVPLLAKFTRAIEAKLKEKNG